MAEQGPSHETLPDNSDAQSVAGHEFGNPRFVDNYRMGIWEFVCQLPRKKISQKRARYVYQNINLDLAYITDRIIAMGYPSTGIEALFRNTMKMTVEFLRRRHGHNHVKVFNLRGGFTYDAENFDNNVINFDMTDHHPPRLELMAPFCREAKLWLDADEKNVIAVHCKAGKGRTGVMICALLIYIHFYENPRQVLDYYSIVRTINNKGVTIPSQRRYIYYYHKLREKELNYFPLRMQLVGVYIENPPKTRKGAMQFKVKVSNGSSTVFDSAMMTITGEPYHEEKEAWRGVSRMSSTEQFNPTECSGFVSRRAYCFMVPEEQPVFVEGDVRVDLLAGGRSRFNKNKIGHVWFNTMFACGMNFTYGDETWRYNEKTGETTIGLKHFGAGREPLEQHESQGEHITLRDGMKILKPPGLDKHTPPKTLENVYESYGMTPPRHRISRLLYEAHLKGIVKDDYNIRKDREKCEEPFVPYGRLEDPKGTKGPLRILYKEGEHILTFPVYEMDRALKDETLGDRLRMHVVLKCIDSSDAAMMEKSERFCSATFANEDRRRAQAASVNAPCVTSARASGAEKQVPPTVQYSSGGKRYDGIASECLYDHMYRNDWKSHSDRWCRYFYKQETCSPSKYPEGPHKCFLVGKEFRLKGPPADDSKNVAQQQKSGTSSNKQQGPEEEQFGSRSPQHHAPISRVQKMENCTESANQDHTIRFTTPLPHEHEDFEFMDAQKKMELISEHRKCLTAHPLEIEVYVREGAKLLKKKVQKELETVMPGFSTPKTAFIFKKFPQNLFYIVFSIDLRHENGRLRPLICALLWIRE
uniref:Phosphatidylinositol-3,4,5-trisphosphate 3-phosphatase n=1 Tax=Caenorhabditis japonica TaxID=281687 RepID=A0A8R1HNR5_CAEJA